MIGLHVSSQVTRLHFYLSRLFRCIALPGLPDLGNDTLDLLEVDGLLSNKLCVIFLGMYVERKIVSFLQRPHEQRRKRRGWFKNNCQIVIDSLLSWDLPKRLPSSRNQIQRFHFQYPCARSDMYCITEDTDRSISVSVRLVRRSIYFRIEIHVHHLLFFSHV